MTALAAASLLAAPAHAQSTPHPGWNFAPLSGGLTSQNMHAQSTDGYTTAGANDTQRPGSTSASAAGTVTFNLYWYGGGTPTPLSVLLNGSASAGGFPGVSASVSDGLGDPVLSGGPPGMGPTSVSSAGKHLVQSSGSGTASFSDTLSATSGNAMGVGVGITASLDSRMVTLHRNNAVAETMDSNGTVHGATTFSYGGEGGLGASTVDNVQQYTPVLFGSWSLNPSFVASGTPPPYNIQWVWSPANQHDPNLSYDDTWGTHYQHIPLGSLMMSSSSHWVGKADAVKHIITTYTVTDLGVQETATATYDLAVHDQYDNFRRVDASKNSLGGNVPDALGSVIQLGQSTTPQPTGAPTVYYDKDKEPVSWTAASDVGGGVLSGTGAVMLGLDLPVWPATIVGVSGLILQTAASYPTDPTSAPAPDTPSAGFLQAAYNNTLSNMTALPGQQIPTNNTVDLNFYNILQNNPDFAGYFSGNKYGQIQIVTTLSVQMLNYYFYCDQYSTAGLVSTTVPSTVTKPGGFLWNYLWDGPSGATAPSLNPGNPSS